jgi:hypothetical protein
MLTGLPSRFGFGLAVPASESNSLFTVPIEASGYRCNPDGKFRVARSRAGLFPVRGRGVALNPPLALIHPTRWRRILETRN